MRFLTLLTFLVFALALAWFSAQNWGPAPVTLNLWPPYQLVIRLPVLMVACVLAGWLPTTALHSISAWRLRRKLVRTERALESTRSVGIAGVGEPFEMPVLKSRAPGAPAPGGFVPPVIPTPPSDGI